MIGVGVQVAVIGLAAFLIPVALGFGLGASWQWNRDGGVEETRLAAAGLRAHCEALQAQNATLVERNTALAARQASWRRPPSREDSRTY